ncbi:MAG: PaaI family thioesterase [Pacificimonas sp.]
MSADVPEGFARHFRKSPLTEPWEPLYSKRDEVGIIVGLRAGDQHCNSRGLVHGGLMSALADNMLGLSCAARHETVSGLVTVTLNLEFLAAAKAGQWLEFRPTAIKTGKTLDAAQGQVTADGDPGAFASATFRVLS